MKQLSKRKINEIVEEIRAYGFERYFTECATPEVFRGTTLEQPITNYIITKWELDVALGKAGIDY